MTARRTLALPDSSCIDLLNAPITSIRTAWVVLFGDIGSKEPSKLLTKLGIKGSFHNTDGYEGQITVFEGGALAKILESNPYELFLVGCQDKPTVDDLSLIAEKPVLKGSEIDFDVMDKIIILIDDVLYTGRTVRSAIAAILDFGRPKQIQLCVLIDRGRHEMPVKADYVGRFVPTSSEEIIKVSFVDTDDDEKVRIMLNE